VQLLSNFVVATIGTCFFRVPPKLRNFENQKRWSKNMNLIVSTCK
jgi:hypothetical protein